jgi:hypothetical protein
MENKTSIQEWIEEIISELIIEAGEDPTQVNNPIYWELRAAAKNSCNELLTYLGLQDVEDPKKWVDDVKIGLADYDSLEFQLSELRAENERLREALKEKQFEVTFGNHLQTLIKVVGNKVEVLNAVNGWGDEVQLTDIKIAEQAHPDLKGETT